MTLQELAFTLGKNESTLYNNFSRTQENLRKKGIIITKWGKGRTAEYELEYDDCVLEQLMDKE